MPNVTDSLNQNTTPEEACREAFEKWINTSTGHGLAFARECWNTAWQAALSTVNPGLIAAMEAMKFPLPPELYQVHHGYFDDAIEKCIALARTHGVEISGNSVTVPREYGDAVIQSVNYRKKGDDGFKEFKINIREFDDAE